MLTDATEQLTLSTVQYCGDMQGNCSSEPAAIDLGLYDTPSLQDWQTGQCVVVTDVHFMRVEQNLWLHRLYIRHQLTNRTQYAPVMMCITEFCNLWMTYVTMQGFGSSQGVVEALSIAGGQLYADGALLTNAEYKFTEHKFYAITLFGICAQTCCYLSPKCSLSINT